MIVDWEAFVKRISFRPSFPLRLEVHRNNGQTFITAMLDAPDIHTGEAQTVHMRWEAPSLECAQPHYMEELALGFVRSLLRATLEHELEECFLLDGQQVWDPHVDARLSR